LGIQTSADFLGLFPVQFTSAPPNQDPAFVIHACSPFSLFWDRCAGPSSSERILPGRSPAKANWAAGRHLDKVCIPVSVAAAVAVAGAGNGAGGHNGCTHVGVGHGRAYLVDFLDGEFTGSCTYQYSVVLSRHTFFSFFFFVTSARLLSSYDLRTKRVFVRAAFGQVRERQLARRAGGAYAFDFFFR
jgi:hypothetical protein